MKSYHIYGRLVPIIVFYIIVYVSLSQSEAYELTPEFEYLDEKISSSIVIQVLGYSVFGYIALTFGYGIEPIRFTNEKHYGKRGYESISVELQTLKIVFVALASLLIAFHIVNVVVDTFSLLGFYFDIIVGITTITIIGAGFRILIHFMHKNFRYYLAKGYCITATKKEDDFEKANYLSATIDSYNKYLRRRTQIEIKDVKRIYSTFLAAEMKEKNQIIKSVCESLEIERLGLARYLSKAYKVPESEFFVAESTIQKMKPVGTFLAAAIPIVVSLIPVLLSLLYSS